MKFEIRIQPNAKKEGLSQMENGIWKLKVSAPALDGRANDRVIEFLSEILDIPMREIEILSGHHGRSKVIGIPDRYGDPEALIKNAIDVELS